MMTIDERWEARGSAGALVMVRGSAGALMVVGIYSEIMDGCEGLGPAQWILAYERGEGLGPAQWILAYERGEVRLVL
ncbi:hypothetical protein PRIPAC_77708 [Pristionchus pacificus]|uniref:Uncharacterized protein n=1 Tax=Pristionchus pacificus TaxID=54126 RepID=A0A2A6CNY3_PRIPA|nr:hypothetical protein PRIPAC_77708 [Pristionchus pacificus]|eukprot:PDM79904.1 hypothetical protein PRIPAC_32483 [Pristionchus pacificus]